MSHRKSTLFYGILIAFVSVVVGMVIASRLDLSPISSANLTVPATNSAPLAGPIDATTFRTIAHDAGPSVVSIITTGTSDARDSDLGDLLGPNSPFGQVLPPFGNRQPRQQAPRVFRGAGSGFIIDKEGYILTNNHVVENAKSIEIRLSTTRDGEEGYPAKVIGRDELTDTALVQMTELPRDGLTASKFGDSTQIAPGDWVMAIGNPFNLSNTVTVGVVSAVGRQTPTSTGRYEDFIQTDAAINRGNSGGPLLNLRGEVVGINSMIYTESGPMGEGGGNVGVGFAIPINTVRDLLPQLRTGKVTRGRIGVTVQSKPMTEDYARELGLSKPEGAEIRSVERGAPADAAGMKAGDVIVEFNGKPIRSNNELVSVVTGTPPNTTVPVKVMRDKKNVSLNVKVGELNLDAERQANSSNRAAPDEQTAEPKDTGFGMTIQEVAPREARQLQVPAGRGGALVTDVTPFGPAAQAGIVPGDVILSIQGDQVRNVDQVSKALDAIGTGRTARIIVWHVTRGQGGQEVLVQIRKR
ncbi:MAG: trypsin-like peptidase domain-containing protein [Vicinamibacterales bacterium]